MRPLEETVANMEYAEIITEYKELEPFLKTIRAQHENILAAAKMRQDFTANVSHELKTPLTAISGYAELIENNVSQSERLIRLNNSARRQMKTLQNNKNLVELEKLQKQVNDEKYLLE